jgi:hypothetical protein
VRRFLDDLEEKRTLITYLDHAEVDAMLAAQDKMTLQGPRGSRPASSLSENSCIQDGDLPAGTDCATLARYTATVLNGLAVQAASGATEKELRLVSALALQAWPS